MRTAYVTLWGQTIGAVAWDSTKQVAFFEYTPAVVNQQLPLAPLHMPAQAHTIYSFAQLHPHTFHGLPGLLADALPDDYGNLLIDAWLARKGLAQREFTPVDRLCYMGKRATGALEFSPALNEVSNHSKPIELTALVELAQHALHTRTALNTQLGNDAQQHAEALHDILRVGTSAGGARAKAVIAWHPQTHAIRSGQVQAPPGYEYWLLKFDGVDQRHLGTPAGFGRIEYAYHLLATRAGIDMMPCRLLTENGRAHFMTQRFDRGPLGEKIHLQSLCAIAHYDYRQAGAYAYEQAFRVMRKLRLPYAAMEQQYRRMVFNVIARNQDDHTKNISFLMTPNGVWRLAPAYDVTYSYNPDGAWTHQHQMTINGKRQDITRDDLLAVARQANINHATHIVDEITSQIATWPTVAQDCGVSTDDIQRIQATLLLL